MASELEYLSAISRIFSPQSSADTSNKSVVLGIGDDGAVLRAPQNSVVLSTDMAVEGDHFKREWSSLFDIGAKITAANLADIFAMGGKPTHLLVAAALPENFSVKEIEELASGIADEVQKVGAVVIGGDLAKSSLLTISITAYGEVHTPITRAGAKVGDVVAVSALPGASMRGFLDLQAGRKSEDVALHTRPQVDYQKISSLSPLITHALCDISDGLVSDAGHIARASGVKIIFDPKMASVSFTHDVLHGGEDHVFLGTFSELPSGWIAIGHVESGAGVFLDGVELHHQGYQHFT